MTTKSGKLWRHVPKLIGPCLLVIVLAKTDLGALAEHLTRTDLRLYALAFSISFVTLFLKALRWRLLVIANPGVRLSVWRGYVYYFSAMFLGAVSPGRVGEIYKIAYVRSPQLPASRAAATVIVDRLVDLLVPACLAAVGVVLFHGRMGKAAGAPWVLWTLLLAGALGLTALYLGRRKLKAALLGLVAISPWADAQDQVRRWSDEFMLAVKSLSARRWSACGIITLVAWALYCLQRILIARAIGLQVDAPYFSFVFLFVAVVSALPVSILGIGTRDAMFAILLASAGVSMAAAVTLSSLILASMLLTMVVGFAFFLATPTPPLQSADNIQDEGPR